MYTTFIECCQHTKNSRTIYLLAQLSKGDEFRYNEYTARSDSKSIHTHRWLGPHVDRRESCTYAYTGDPCTTIISNVENIFRVSGDTRGDQVRVVKDYIIRDFVVDLIRTGQVERGTARKLYSQIVAAQMLKQISMKDFAFRDNKIVNMGDLQGHGLFEPQPVSGRRDPESSGEKISGPRAWGSCPRVPEEQRSVAGAEQLRLQSMPHTAEQKEVEHAVHDDSSTAFSQD